MSEHYPRSPRLRGPKPPKKNFDTLSLLTKTGFYRGENDGIFGRKTDEAVRYILSNSPSAPPVDEWRSLGIDDMRELAIKVARKDLKLNG